MAKKPTESTTLLHSDIDRYLAGHAPDPEMTERLQELQRATQTVAALRDEFKDATEARRKADEALLAADQATRRSLISEWALIDGELVAIERQISEAERARLTAKLAALQRVWQLASEELTEIEGREAGPLEAIRTARPGATAPEDKREAIWASLRPARAELERLRSRKERVYLVRNVARIQAERIDSAVKLAQPATWRPVVAKAATRRVAA